MTSYKTNIQKLDSPWRRTALPPGETLLQLGLNETGNLADIGCGIGYFAIPAAEIVGPEHKVFAIDPSTEMLEAAAARGREAGVSNISFIHSDPEDFKMPSDSVEFALLANVFHEIPQKETFVRLVWDILKPCGKLMLVEWNGEMREFGPPEDHRLNEVECDRLMTAGGFAIHQKLDIGEMFYGRVYIKQC
jgi:ubiquinone/menaquinone biosynthesis C-methylase UbiE